MTPLASGDLLWPPEAPESSFFSLHRYLNNQVFVSLANGELVVYQREAGECPPRPTAPHPAHVAGVGTLRKAHESGDVALGTSQALSGPWCPHVQMGFLAFHFRVWGRGSGVIPD